jgi:hypothetical protein
MNSEFAFNVVDVNQRCDPDLARALPPRPTVEETFQGPNVNLWARRTFLILTPSADKNARNFLNKR